MCFFLKIFQRLLFSKKNPTAKKQELTACLSPKANIQYEVVTAKQLSLLKYQILPFQARLL